MLIMFLISFMVLTTVSLIVWWSLFTVSTIVALVKIKLNASYGRSMLTYFVVQESASITFGGGFDGNLILGALLLKGGFSPLHVWMTKVMNGVFGLSLSWILTIQKLPFLVALSALWSWDWYLPLVVSTTLPLIQGLFIKSLWHLVFLMMTSSSSMLLLLGCTNLWSGVFTFTLYSVSMYTLIGWVSKTHLISVGYEVVLTLMALPYSLPFNVKLIFLYSNFSGGLLILPLLLGFVLNSACGLKLLYYLHSSVGVINKLTLVYFPTLILLILL